MTKDMHISVSQCSARHGTLRLPLSSHMALWQPDGNFEYCHAQHETVQHAADLCGPLQAGCPEATELRGALTLPVFHQVPVVEHAVEDTLALWLQDMDEGCEGPQLLLSIQKSMHSAADMKST